MPEEPPVAQLVTQMLDVAASAAPLLERARALVEALDRWLRVEAIWLTLSDPESNVYATVGSSGLERSVREYLDRPSGPSRVLLTGLGDDRRPISVTVLPVPAAELPTWADCLIPAGSREGLEVPLLEPGGHRLGMLSLLFSSDDPPSVALRDRLGKLAPLIARALSPTGSLLASARLVRGATSGVVLLRDGSTHPLPGLRDDTLLDADSLIVCVARHTLLTGQVYRSFMWPTEDAEDTCGHVRVTVLAATDVPPFMLGTVLLSAHTECRGLTPREMEVLGLMVDGGSNQEIARRLVIAPRTVATHVEHILSKLEVPTRTLAAVRAEREGCYVPTPR